MARGSGRPASGGGAQRAPGGVPRQPGVRACSTPSSSRSCASGFTHERLLEWESAAATANRSRVAASRRVRQAHDREPAGGRRRAGRGGADQPARGARGAAAAAVLDRPRRRSRSCSADRRRRAASSSAARTGEFLLAVARNTWRYFETFTGPAGHALPPDNVQMTPDARDRASHVADQHRDGAPRHRVGARPGLHRSRRDDRADRSHPDDGRGPRTLRRAPAQLVRHRHARAAPARVRLHRGQRQPGGCARHPRVGPGPPGCRRADRPVATAARLHDLAARAGALFDEHELQAALRRAPPVVRDRLSPGRRRRAMAVSTRRNTTCSLPRRVWPASSRSAKATCPNRTGSISAGPRPPCDGAPVLLSWSATLFEYLMPLLLTRTYPGTLLDESCRMAVRRQIDYGERLGVPWGISESAYNAVDRHGTYQYKAFGVPGLGLKRGLGDELVVAPYASALAAVLVPAQSAKNLRRLAAHRPRRRVRVLRCRGLHGSRRRPGRRAGGCRQSGHRPHLHGAPPGHDAGGAGQRAPRRPDGRAFSPGLPRAGHRTPASGAAAARRAGAAAPACRRSAGHRARRRCRSAGIARRTRCSRTRNSCRMGGSCPSSRMPAAAA